MKKIVVSDVACERDGSFVNVTSDSEAYSKYWIAILVQMNCEKRVASKLQNEGYETYVPVQTEVHRWSDRKKRIDRIIIPMVVFVRVARSEEEWLRKQSYVSKLLAMPGSEEAKKGAATRIPDYQVDQLRYILDNAEERVTVVSNLHVGDKVEIVDGALKGLRGELVMINTTTTVAVRVELLGYVCVSISVSSVKHIDE